MVLNKDLEKHSLQPKKFVLWLFIVSSIIFFAGLTSGFIVYSGDGAGKSLNVDLPKAFIYSTVVIVVSSLTMYLASLSAKKLKFAQQKLWLWVTFALGLLFISLQVYGWTVWTGLGIYFVNSNATISFVYALSLFHVVHIVAGLIMILTALKASYGTVPSIKNTFRMEITSIFWHFVDIVWIYLYLFLLLNQ
ncbi:MAG TPA: cytochrome c oxidase subunit 3 [Pelobium sp.]|nr:cytochrome c oxidase subunit 3 [Pelobium sp.]